MRFPNIRKNTRLQVLIPVCVFVLAVIIILLCIIPSTKDAKKIAASKSEQQTVQDAGTESLEQKVQKNTAEECTDSAVNDFFRNYYQAMADGDEAAMDTMFDQSGYVTTSNALSELIEEYRNIRVYTAEGLQENELAAFVYSDLKFNNIETPAPSMESFYLSTREEKPVIMTSMYTDPQIAEYLTALSKKDPVKSIMQSTEAWLATTLQNDETLKEIYDKMRDYIADSEGK